MNSYLELKLNDNYSLRLSYSKELSDWWWYLVRNSHKEVIAASGELVAFTDSTIVPWDAAREEAIEWAGGLVIDLEWFRVQR